MRFIKNGATSDTLVVLDAVAAAAVASRTPPPAAPDTGDTSSEEAAGVVADDGPWGRCLRSVDATVRALQALQQRADDRRAVRQARSRVSPAQYE